MVSLTIVGCLVPYNDPELLNGSGSTDANASPFVIAVKNAGISVVPSIMNVSIMIKFCYRSTITNLDRSSSLLPFSVLAIRPSTVLRVLWLHLQIVDRRQRFLDILTMLDDPFSLSSLLAQSVSFALSSLLVQTHARKRSIGCWLFLDFLLSSPGAPSTLATFDSDRHGSTMAARLMSWRSGRSLVLLAHISDCGCSKLFFQTNANHLTGLSTF